MFVDLDGARVYAYTGGKVFDAKLPVVVFVHGAQHDHSAWALQSRYFAHHGHAVLAIDLPGHGRSEGPALTTVEAIAAWTLRLVATVGAASATIVGHSMGSLAAVEAASQSRADDAPAHVDRIVAIAISYPMQVSDALLAVTRDDEPRAINMVSIWSSDQSHGGFAQKWLPGFSAVWSDRRVMERQPRGVMHVDFAACHAYRNGEQAAANVACPALFVLAAKDAMTQTRSGRAFAKTIAGARVVELAGIGHNAMAEAPDAVLDALREFLRST